MYLRDAEQLITRAEHIVQECMEKFEMSDGRGVNRLKSEIRNELSEFIWKEIHRRPMILPIITEAY